MSLASSRVSFFATIGTGLFVGFSGVVLYMRLTNRILAELQRVYTVVTELRQEVSDLKEKVETASRRRPRKSGFYSVVTSSGEEDDVWEEAYGGSDLELLKDNEDRNTTETTKDDTQESVLTQVDKLFGGSDTDTIQAYQILENNKTKYLIDAEYFWRISKCSFLMSQIEGAKGNTQRKKELVYSAKDLAYTAIGLDEGCSNAHKWYAITIGSVGDYESTQEKIKNGYTYKDHIEKAIKINPTDSSNHYLLGRWCHGVYMLSWLERKAASALFAEPPTSTAEEALTHFLEADRLKPGDWKENMLYIGKCYIEIRQYPEAVQWLQKARDRPVKNQDDRDSQTEIETLLATYDR